VHAAKLWASRMVEPRGKAKPPPWGGGHGGGDLQHEPGGAGGCGINAAATKTFLRRSALLPRRPFVHADERRRSSFVSLRDSDFGALGIQSAKPIECSQPGIVAGRALFFYWAFSFPWHFAPKGKVPAHDSKRGPVTTPPVVLMRAPEAGVGRRIKRPIQHLVSVK
jgi:hypothetical protein